MNSDSARSVFFDSHPDPMWVYERSTLLILDVNDAAIRKYGYERGEFLAMTIRELRPSEDIAALEDHIAQRRQAIYESGIWCHQLKSGERIFVDIRSHTVDYNNVPAVLVSTRDATERVETERLKEHVLEHEQTNRMRAEATASYFQALFESVPGNYLVLDPASFEIIAASNAFLEAMHADRDFVIGRPLFELMPDSTADIVLLDVEQIRASLELAKITHATEYMDACRYPIVTRAGDAMFWSITNKPVLGSDDKVAFIIHHVQDVETIAHVPATPEEQTYSQESGDENALGELVNAHGLREANIRLQHQRTMLRHAQRLVEMGSWELNLLTDELYWSESIYQVFGVDKSEFDGTYEAFLKLVHPDDRDELDRVQSISRANLSLYDFTHRIVKPDGSIRIVREVAEVVQTPSGPFFAGAVQDITTQRNIEDRLREASALLDTAGRTGKFGGWRANLTTNTVKWSKETCAIHEVAESYSPSSDDGVVFYVPGDRERIQGHIQACTNYGAPFDGVFQITTAKNRLRSVRVTGEADRNVEGRITSIQGSIQDISELVIAREAAASSAINLELTLESINDAFFTLDEEWRFTYLNAQAQRLLERERRDLLGKVAWDVFPETTDPSFRLNYEDAVRNKSTQRFTSHYAPLRRWFDVSAYPTDTGIAVYFRDVTESRVQQQELDLLKYAVERLNDIILITDATSLNDPNGPKIIFANDAFTRVTGYTKEEVIGKTPRILQGPKTQRVELDRIAQAVQGAQEVHAELINYSKDGKEYWLELDILPLWSREGVLTHFVAIERDITDRKRVEEISSLSQERFRLLAQATNDAVWDWDIGADSFWWNDGFITMFGETLPNMEGGIPSYGALIHKDDRDRVLSGIRRLVEGGPTHWSTEYRCVGEANRVIWVTERGFAIRNSEGIAVRMLASIVDVSKRYERDERTRQSQKLEAVGQLTGGIAHDFNNLLTIIMGNAELLVEELEGHPDLCRFATLTAAAAQRGAELTGRLLAFARKQALEPKVLDVSKLITGIYDMVRRTLSEDIQIEVVRGGGLWKAEVDPGQLELAILNLVINARDAMPSGGRLTLETANAFLDDAYSDTNDDLPAGQYVLLCVSDTGVGMRPEVVARVFEPFFTTKPVGKGTGLGLSMTYGFVKQSGGHIKVYSEVDLGTTVKIYLPRAVSDTDTRSLRPVVPRRDLGGTEHILVVEDDVEVRATLVDQLKLLGYKITAAENGADAISALEKDHSIAMLFTDIVMPGGMNGRQLADQAKVIRPDLRILFTSGYTENAIVHHGRVDRGVHLLSKPYRRQELALKVRKVLDE